jgi:lysophospholipase L1-like esterase
MQKVLVIGDSCSLPRGDVPYEACWPWLLSTEFSQFTFINLSQRSSTVRRLVSDGGGADDFPQGSDCLEFYQPTGVILQLGIVDCAPRLFREGGLEQWVIRKLPLSLRNAYIRFVRKVRCRTATKVRVPPSEFEAHLSTYLQRCEKLKLPFVIAIAIGGITDAVARQSPFFRTQIETYNQIYRKLASCHPHFRIIDPYDSDAEISHMTTDGYHPNVSGNKMIAHRLSEVLQESVHGSAHS